MLNSLSIVIPCFNEEKRLLKTLTLTYNWCKDNIKNFEIILVDDGSWDNTKNIMYWNASLHPEIKIIEYEENRGKGYAVKQGVQSSQYKYCLFMDADNATSISEVTKFEPYINDYDLVIASRNLKDSRIMIKQPLMRRLMGKVFSRIVRFAIKTKTKDTQCGFKLFNTRGKELFNYQTCERFAFDVELIKNAELAHYKIKEVGVDWYNNEQSKVHPILDVINMFKDVMKIWKLKRKF